MQKIAEILTSLLYAKILHGLLRALAIEGQSPLKTSGRRMPSSG